MIKYRSIPGVHFAKQFYEICILAWLVRLFIVATGCPSERRPQKTVSCYGDSARIKDETTENSAWFFNVHSTVTRDLGLKSHPKDHQ